MGGGENRITESKWNGGNRGRERGRNVKMEGGMERESKVEGKLSENGKK